MKIIDQIANFFFKGLNYIAGMLLLITKDEKQSFWLLVEILERLVPGIIFYQFFPFVPDSLGRKIDLGFSIKCYC